MECKKMDHAHAEQVYQIEELSFVTPWGRKSIKTEIDNKLGRYIVIMDGDKVAAYGGFWLVLDEANINNVAVHPDYRGKKISKMLMNKLMEMAVSENAKHMYLEVRSSNSIAQGLYRGLGFKMIGLRSGYYTDTDEDAIVMMKEF
ncbi:ribosomal protein S18-alanine N-acetyltransferase [Proteocatella sphenisci]|uniref:ribosomal protein S18-alanine N-acetyltransferase n=1 Tax=Proteocatella sphenisci TaxID=181070 RepID=UPI00048A5F73|nr:ribosomal protein S18-alanine N-acetyltransferase [Proteocatella sphenisci]